MSFQKVHALDGSSFDVLVTPPEDGRGPALLVLHEVFGLTPGIRALCLSYAQKGFVVICPHLFWRQGPVEQIPPQTDGPDWGFAKGSYKNYDVESGVRDMLSVVAFARKHPACGGRVGVLGYCLGSRLAFLLAARSDIDCCVGYYGVGLESYSDEAQEVSKPTLLHFAEQDKLMSSPARKKLLGALSRCPNITCHVYPVAEHGFAREGDPKYHAESAGLAQTRTDAFLKGALFD